MTAWLVGMFAALTLLLAAIGVYGVLAYLVTQRTREIGVRIALGARPGSVLRLPYIETQLFGIKVRDLVTLATAAGSLLLVAGIAAYLPARRATRVDPLTAAQDRMTQ